MPEETGWLYAVTLTPLRTPSGDRFRWVVYYNAERIGGFDEATLPSACRAAEYCITQHHYTRMSDG